MKNIIQAGGKGSRLEWLTHNKPKCLVSVNNLPIIFYIFKKFPTAEFKIISDYKSDVLKRYLDIFATNYNYEIIVTKEAGTASGIKIALQNFSNDEAFMIIWCDLILSNDFNIPSEIDNYIGISKDFECRWSYINNEFIKEPSKEDGVAGLFIFKNKEILKNIPEKGAFVPWLKTQNIKFKRLNLNKTKEIGTLLSYSDNNININKCRPFNSINFVDDIVIKQAITEQGEKIAIDECAWYKHVNNLGFNNIPELYEYKPLTMKKIEGKNIYEYDCLTIGQKKEILEKIITSLRELHDLESAKPANNEDVTETYITKTFARLEKVRNLIPFANQEFIKINGQYYKNIFFYKKEFIDVISKFFPTEFKLIHGDCTFSNILFDTFNMRTVLIDPRGYFGNTKLYGDVDYDWAKIYYSLKGDYDQFNLKKFTLDIKEKEVEFAIKSNNWTDMEDYFFELLPEVNRTKIKFLHTIIWLSLTTYTWDDYDSICGAFYNGIIKLNEVL